MTRHKHAEMIKAKADNIELCMFIKEYCGWVKNTEIFPVEEYPLTEDKEYFLCLPQHKEVCLHWLNGGEIEILSGNTWVTYDLTILQPKYALEDFTGTEFQFRIKPRKEKRWIAFKWNNFYVLPRHYETKEAAEIAAASSMMGEFQYQQIEVEV